jgi:hypothetical protein
MNRSFQKRFQEKLYPRLIYSPFLRLVLFNFWFRLAFGCFLILAAFLALFLPRIWTTTPPGFKPVVRISGLDKAQAWSLKRSAIRAAKAGDFEAAQLSWSLAVANNSADPELLRGLLQNTLQLERTEPRQAASALPYAGWLLRLTATNEMDLDRVAQLYDRFQLFDVVLRLLGPRRDRLSGPQESVYLKALFHAGEMREFGARWERLGDRLKSDGELALYHAAFLAGWGPATEAGANQDRLKAAEDSPLKIPATRLQLLVSARRQDLDGYHAALQKLERWQSDTLLHHIGYWRLLALSGQKTEAQRLALTHPQPPNSGMESVRLADACVELGLKEVAYQALRKATAQFSGSIEVWIRLASLLIEEERWEELRSLALQIRQNDATRDVIAGYSYYLEGRAELGLSRDPIAAAAFEKAGRHPFEFATLGLATAASLVKLGYPAVADEILSPLENQLRRNPEYWQTLFTVAHQLRRPETLLTAATRAYELEPGSVVCANNYAAALLVNRRQPDEAIKLTLQIMDWFPNSNGAKINHALALLLNRRVGEAAALLGAIHREKLNAIERTSLNLGWFEASLAQQQYDKAREASDGIDVNRLYPNQRKWLEEARQQLPARTAAP